MTVVYGTSGHPGHPLFIPPPEGNFLVKPYVCQIYLALTCFSQYQNLLDPQQRSWPAEPACCCCVRAFDERPR